MIHEAGTNFPATLCPALLHAYHVLVGEYSSTREELPSETLRARSKERERETRVLFDDAQANGQIFSTDRLGPRVDGGTEHDVYQAADRPGWLYKVTYANYSGFTHRALKLKDSGVRVMEDDALPSEYLYRWLLHNTVFGDDADYMGIIYRDNAFRIVIAQREIEGGYPDANGVIDYLENQLCFQPVGDGRWLRCLPLALHPVALADTKPANFILTPGGQVHAIDVVLFEPGKVILDYWDPSNSLFSNPS